jgi:Mg-chelatase subunit ChlD
VDAKAGASSKAGAAAQQGDPEDVHIEPESVDVSVKSAKAENDEEHYVLVTVAPPPGQRRTPVDICCVIDISGSMDSIAEMKDADGGVETHGLSLLDVVKHAVRTICHSLQENDRLSIVTFSDKARTDMGLKYMADDKAKQEVFTILDNMHTEGCTNIWGGLEAGLNVLKKGTKSSRNSCVLLLTDGQPTEHDAPTMLQRFTQYKDKNQIPCVVSTFGFGYAIDTSLLATTAIQGNGMFSFIPDCSFVGTTFVNAVSNVLATMGTDVSISFEPQNGASIVGVLGNHLSVESSWGTMVTLPSIQYGQHLDLVVKMKVPASLPKDTPYVDVTLKFNHWKFGPSSYTAQGQVSEEVDHEVQVQRRRLTLVKSLQSLVSSPGKADVVAALIADLKEGTDPREKAMFEDVAGQVREAIMEQYYNRWGKHYLPSLSRAHQLQQSNNFKDPGIQCYGGELFNKLRDEVDEIFSKLPPPKPSHRRGGGGGGGGGAPANFSMANYNTPTGGCFAGSGLVLMANGTYKRVSEIKKGDMVATLNNQHAEVLCVMKIHCEKNQADLVEIEGGLLITPFHPIKIGDRWQFPCAVSEPAVRYARYVYNFVLKDGGEHAMIVNGVTCVTLAHHYDEEVVRHSYFGSQKVLEDLRCMYGFERGLVEVRSDCFVRDAQTGLICAIAKDAEVNSSHHVVGGGDMMVVPSVNAYVVCVSA